MDRFRLAAAIALFSVVGAALWFRPEPVPPEPVILCCPASGGPCEQVDTFSACGPGKLAGECSCPEKVEGGYFCPKSCPAG